MSASAPSRRTIPSFLQRQRLLSPHSTVHTVYIMAFVYEERAPMKKHTKSKLHGSHMIFEASFNFWDPRKGVECSDQGKERLSVEQIPRSLELL